MNDTALRADVEATEPEAEASHRTLVLDKSARALLFGIFFIAAGACLYFARDFLLPVTLAFLFALVLSPVVRWLRKHGVPSGVGAVVLVVAALGAIGFIGYTLSAPARQLIADAPTIIDQVQEKIETLRQPVDALIAAQEQVEQATGGGDDGDVQRVVVSEPGLLTRAATGVPELLAKMGLTLVLTVFLLASGDMFYEKLVKVLPTLHDKKRALRIARSVEREVSRYLLTITLINIGLGVFTAIGLWLVGMPNPLLWGTVACFFNYIPVLGAVVGTSLLAAVALVSLPTFGGAVVAVLVYVGLATIESQLVTPLILGRRLEMNAVVIFVSVAFWGWIWGIVGAMIAVPVLVALKVFSDHVESMHGLGEFLAARHHTPIETPAPAAQSPPVAAG